MYHLEQEVQAGIAHGAFLDTQDRDGHVLIAADLLKVALDRPLDQTQHQARGRESLAPMTRV